MNNNTQTDNQSKIFFVCDNPKLLPINLESEVIQECNNLLELHYPDIQKIEIHLQQKPSQENNTHTCSIKVHSPKYLDLFIEKKGEDYASIAHSAIKILKEQIHEKKEFILDRKRK